MNNYLEYTHSNKTTLQYDEWAYPAGYAIQESHTERLLALWQVRPRTLSKVTCKNNKPHSILDLKMDSFAASFSPSISYQHLNGVQSASMATGSRDPSISFKLPSISHTRTLLESASFFGFTAALRFLARATPLGVAAFLVRVVLLAMSAERMRRDFV